MDKKRALQKKKNVKKKAINSSPSFHLSQVLKNIRNMKHVPKEILNEAFLHECINKKPSCFKYIEKTKLNSKLKCFAVKKDYKNIENLLKDDFPSIVKYNVSKKETDVDLMELQSFLRYVISDPRILNFLSFNEDIFDHILNVIHPKYRHFIFQTLKPTKQIKHFILKIIKYNTVSQKEFNSLNDLFFIDLDFCLKVLCLKQSLFNFYITCGEWRWNYNHKYIKYFLLLKPQFTFKIPMNLKKNFNFWKDLFIELIDLVNRS